LALLFAGFVFTAWQIRLSNTQASTPMPVGVPLIPTPSASSTRTLISMQTCALFAYQVKPGDTLASIVQQFDVSAEEIMVFNDLGSETISTL
jgi:LysM repeat protein